VKQRTHTHTHVCKMDKVEAVFASIEDTLKKHDTNPVRFTTHTLPPLPRLSRLAAVRSNAVSC
jgi:hypothetical protein